MGRKKSNRQIYVADFETTSKQQYLLEGETKVYLWEMKDLQNENKYVGVNIQSFFEEVYKIDKPSLIFFHNLSFDGEFILWYLMRNGYTDIGEIDDAHTKPKTIQTIITDTSCIFMIKIVTPNNVIIEFRCSYRIFPMSIKAIGKMVGLAKLDETHNYSELKNYQSIEDVTDEEWMYLENDVEILRRLIQYLNGIGMLNISMATNAYKSWKASKYLFVKQQLVKSEDEKVNTYIDKSYKGGITAVSKRVQGKLIGKSISLDVNSLYPSQMYDNTMPIGEGIYFEDYTKCQLPKKIFCIYIDKVKIIGNMQPFIGTTSGFSYDCSYNYDEVLEDRFIYLWEEEYNLFKDWYEGTFQIIGCVGFHQAKNVFNDYIDHWMKIKMESENDSAERQFSKLQLNSLYGKFGMNSLRYSKKPKCINGENIEYEVDETETFYYYRAIASYITSRARCKLVSSIALVRDRFLYCDTDSIYLEGWEIPNDILDIDDKKLGYWKFEHYYNHFKALKAKCYLKDYTKNGKIVYDSSIAGLPKDARGSITYDNFEDGLKIAKCKKCKKKVKGGIIIDEIDFQIKVKIGGKKCQKNGK